MLSGNHFKGQIAQWGSLVFFIGGNKMRTCLSKTRASGASLSILVTLCFISGCFFVKSNVSVFHNLPENTNLTKYAFFCPVEQRSSLEYKTYQSLIREELSKYHYAEVTQGEVPDVIITFTYGIDNGRQENFSMPIWGQTVVTSSHTQGTLTTYGNYGTFTGTTTYTPTYGVVGKQHIPITKFSRFLYLIIVDTKKRRNRKPKCPLRR